MSSLLKPLLALTLATCTGASMRSSPHADRMRILRGHDALHEVAFGYRTVSLVEPDALPDAQLGYAVDPDGRDLTGPHEGDWSRNWLVIGHEDLNGDPIFVDTGSQEWPVYTAPHGMGVWQPEPIADSFQRFLAALALVRAVAIGRETPVALEGNPLPERERRRVLDQIQSENPNATIDFWESWLAF